MSKQSTVVAGRHNGTDMTQGSIFGHILTFALPLLAGNLFQQLYNTVDTWVVGNYVGAEAFAAVGEVTQIVNMLIGVFTGLASGAGVVISQYFGARNEKKVHDAVHTSIMMTVILSVVLTIIGIAMTPLLLNITKVAENIYPYSKAYLTIYFAGMTGSLFYNIGAGILRAVGDSRRPFYFLIVSALLNTVLDLVFVLVFHMGVEGVAWATVIAQTVSALLVMATLMRSHNWIRVTIRDVRLHADLIKKILAVGIPASVQMAITSFSNVFVHSYINQFGGYCTGGYTAYHKIDQLVQLPMSSLSLSATTFVGQNLGKGQVERAKKGIRTALCTSLFFTVTLSSVAMICAPWLVSFLNDTPEVVEYGVRFLYYLTPFYLVCCFNSIYTGALRGAGDSRAPMFIMLSTYVLFRQLYMFVMSNYIANEIIPLVLGYPASWLLCSILTFIYFKKSDFGRKVVVAKSEIKNA